MSESQPRHVSGANDGPAQQWNLVRQKLLLIGCGSVAWAVSHLLLGLVGIGGRLRLVLSLALAVASMVPMSRWAERRFPRGDATGGLWPGSP